MPSAARIVAIALCCWSVGQASGAAAQQAAAPAQRCTGTLCDLYYGTSESDAPPPQQAAPTPLTVPKSGILDHFFSGGQAAQPGTPSAPAAAAPGSLVSVQGGGLAGRLSGAPEERCTGTLCDLYYGSTPSEAPVAQASAQAAPGPAVVPETAPRTVRKARTAEVAERQEKARCAAAGRDPWQCYR